MLITVNLSHIYSLGYGRSDNGTDGDADDTRLDETLTCVRRAIPLSAASVDDAARTSERT